MPVHVHGGRRDGQLHGRGGEPAAEDPLKGGFLLASDYHGSWSQEQFDDEIGRALPRGEFPIVDLSPPNHPLWHTMFQVEKLPQMASIATWRRTGGDTVERWNVEGAPPDARGIADEKGRLMVLMIHNTDLPDPWEREAESPEVLFQVFAGRLRRRHQYPALRVDPLTPAQARWLS